jgi:hypothetical protein
VAVAAVNITLYVLLVPIGLRQGATDRGFRGLT